MDRRVFTLGALGSVSVLLTNCATPASTGPNTSQLQTIATDIGMVASVVASDVPLILHGGANATIQNALAALQQTAAQVAQNGASLNSVQGVVNVLNVVLAAAKADPQVPANVVQDITYGQILMTAAVGVFQVAAPLVGLAAAPDPNVERARLALRARLGM